jgi:hypothetical protein
MKIISNIFEIIVLKKKRRRFYQVIGYFDKLLNNLKKKKRIYKSLQIDRITKPLIKFLKRYGFNFTFSRFYFFRIYKLFIYYYIFHFIISLFIKGFLKKISNKVNIYSLPFIAPHPAVTYIGYYSQYTLPIELARFIYSYDNNRINGISVKLNSFLKYKYIFLSLENKA